MIAWLGSVGVVAAAGQWEPLFNGRDLTGWRVECREADQGKEYWRAAGGAIECDTRGDRQHDYVWLVSEREFGDFELECWVESSAGSPGNSGIQVRSRVLDHPQQGRWMHGPQVDVHPPAPWRCGMIYDETWEARRWISPSMPDWKAGPEEGPARWGWVHADGTKVGPASPGGQVGGAWRNQLRIVARGTRVEVTVNGHPVTRFEGGGILDDEAHRAHQVGLRGHLALQLHGGDDLKIRYGGLRVRGLDPLGGAAPVRVVRDDAQLREALGGLGPGAVVRIAPGRYRPGLGLSGVAGTAERPVLIEALDPRDPPRFEGGSQAWHLSDVAHLTLRWLRCRGQQHNGINIDDGGSYDTPSHHVELRHLTIEDVGPQGNFDAIKCSGVDDLRILNCEVAGWGGQAIDFVGCHRAEIAHCTIRGRDGFSQHTGPQFKGGSADVWLHHCRFEQAGMRPVQAGGSTGLDYFRPLDAPFEAARIRIEDNLIIGGQCAVAFTGVDGCEFRYNTLVRPDKWVLRILQESTQERFAHCGNVRFEHNLVVFERAQVGGVANIGPHTRPETFTFRGNHWFAADAPERSRPELPVAEEGGVHGVDPQLDLTSGVAKVAAGRR